MKTSRAVPGVLCLASLGAAALGCAFENEPPRPYEGQNHEGSPGTNGDGGENGEGDGDAEGSVLPEWPGPEATGEKEMSVTMALVGETYDGGMKRHFGVEGLGTGNQNEDQPALFDLYDGAVLQNVILGSPAADGVHCTGSCTLRNVWWEDVGEDAATFLGVTDEDTLLVEGGGAKLAEDKVFQHNGRGTFHLKDVFVSSFGKVYRSCGNCENQVPRRVIVEDLIIVPGPGSSAIVGVNENYGDVAEFRGTTEIYDLFDTPICERYIGNDMSLNPSKSGSGPDGKHCLYDDASVVVHTF